MTERDLRSHVGQHFHFTKKQLETCGSKQQPLPVLIKSGPDEPITTKDTSFSREIHPQAREEKGASELQLWATITQFCCGCRKI